MVTATVIGDEALAAKFIAAAVALEREKPVWLYRCGELVEEGIKSSIQRQGLIDTHALIDSGRVFYPTANGISVGFGKGLDYAEPLELGAIAHPISAVNGPNLVFWWEKAGMTFIGPKVMHPGNIAYRYVYQGTLSALAPILIYFAGRLRALFGAGL
jgi:hypothetical protein